MKNKDNIILFIPYSIFLLPVFPGIKVINYIYLFGLAIYMILKIKSTKYQGIKISVVSMLFIVFYATISLIWSRDLTVGINILLGLITGTIVSIAISYFINIQMLNKFLKHFYVCTNTIILFSIYELISGNYLFVKDNLFLNINNSYGFHFPITFFANTNDLAYYLLFAYPVCMYYKLKKNKSRLNKIINIIYSILVIFILMNTESRITLMCFFIYLIAMVIFYCRKKSIRVMKVSVGILLGIVVVVVYSLINNVNLYQELGLDNLINIDPTQQYYTGRMELLIKSYNLGIETFFIGGGIGTITSSLKMPPHSPFALIWADLGIIPFSILLFSWISGSIKLYIICKKNLKSEITLLSNVIFVLWLTFPFSSMITSAAEQRKITWYFLGLVLAVVKIYNTRNENFPINSIRRRK